MAILRRCSSNEKASWSAPQQELDTSRQTQDLRTEFETQILPDDNVRLDDCSVRIERR